MKFFWLPGLLITTQICLAQPKVTTLDKSTLPKNLLYSGRIVKAVRWTDSLGTNIVITSETGVTASKGATDPDYRDAALFAYQYSVNKDGLKPGWKVYDFIKQCPVDVVVSFVKNTFAVTDLNKDGKAEVWLMYRTGCHGDVSPDTMKIIMYENGRKYILRGRNKVRVSEKTYEGGEYTVDAAFRKAPAVFRTYASQLWQTNSLKTNE